MKFLNPFRLLIKEKTYWFWPIFILLFGFLNIIVGLLSGEKSYILQIFSDGQVYLFSLSVCAPFVTTFALNFIVRRKNKQDYSCITIKMVSILINIIFIIINVSLWNGVHKTTIWIQGIILLLTIIFATYMFCIQELDNHPDILRECDDETYLDKENTRKNKTSEKEAALSEVGGNKL